MQNEICRPLYYYRNTKPASAENGSGKAIKSYSVLTKTLLIMKFTAFFLLVVCLQASAGADAQKITLSEKNASLQKIFRAIKKQTNYSFFFDEAWIQQANKVSIDVSDEELRNVLDICFLNQPLTYSIVGTTVVVKKREPVFIKPEMDSVEVVRQITGKVTDEKGLPLAGASVVLTSTGKGTSTNESGEFTIEANNGDVLEISIVGYKTVTVNVGSQSQLSIQLSLDIKEVNEVVVTALGIKQISKSLVYATQNVKPSELTEVRDPNNVLNSLQGKVANVLITQSSSGVGGDVRFILRGNRSLTGNSSALIVVDGVPGGDPGIQPDNIESITILPGASAAALYGSAAGNGVIVITTKKGAANKLSVNLNSGIVFESPFALPKLQNTYGQGSGGVIDGNAGDSWGPKMTGQSFTNHLGEQSTYTAQPDNINDFFRNGTSLNNSINVSGGSEKAQTFLSYTNNAVQGIVPGNNLMSHIVNLRVTNQISKRFSTDAKVTYLSRNIDNRPRTGEGNTPVLDVYQLPRNMSTSVAKNFETVNNTGVLTPSTWPSTQSGVYGNPYWVNNRDILDLKRDNVVGFLRAKFQITDWLNITGSGNIDKVIDQLEQKTYQGTWSWANEPGGLYARSTNVFTQKWFDVMLEGSNKISSDFKVNYNAGAIYTNNKSDQATTTANGLSVPNKFSLGYARALATTNSQTEVETQSVFGKATVSYRDAVYVDASLRNDWVSVLPPPHSFEYYSIGTSVILSDLINLPEKISFLKVNLSYAEVGNGGQFGLLNPYYNFVPGVDNGAIYRNTTLPFSTLKPEVVKSTEAGIQAKFARNRLGFGINFYKSNAINQLLSLRVPLATGYNTRYINAGNIQNKGVEVLINATPISSPDLTWAIDFNFGLNRNKVVEISDNITVIHYGFSDWGGYPQAEVGGRFGDMTGAQWYKNDKGQFVVDATGKPITTSDMGLAPKVIGNPNPDATMGLTNSISFKGFSLRVLVDGRMGGEIVSGTEMNLSFSGITEPTTQYRDGGWSLGGVDDAGAPVSEEITAQDFWQSVSSKRFGTGEFFLYDATNFRVRELSIGYNIPVKNIGFITSMRLSAVGRNLLWLYRGKSKLDLPGLGKRKMWFDPDISLYNGNFQGIEYGAMPSTRSLGFNLQVTF
jgi:TonB-linked SusC/RagA family outer membrane protein